MSKRKRKTLEKLKNQLEQSISVTNICIQDASNNGYYQAAADLKQQTIGTLFALALINQELEDLRV